MALQRLALAEAMDPACDAALRGDLGGVRQHLQAAASLEGYSINAKGTRARTPLYQACLSRSPEVAEWLLTHGAVDDDGSAYICICAMGAERSADPGERTAAIMRRYGFSGRQKTSDIVRADGASGKQKKQAIVLAMPCPDLSAGLLCIDCTFTPAAGCGHACTSFSCTQAAVRCALPG